MDGEDKDKQVSDEPGSKKGSNDSISNLDSLEPDNVGVFKWSMLSRSNI